MNKGDSPWGPKFPHYSRISEDSIDNSFDAYIQRKESLSEASHDLMPLSVLETALAVGENMHKVGFHTGNKIFPVLMKTIRGYTDIHKGQILNHYYGLLCVRHLIRMVCIGTLKQNKMLDSFLEELKPSMKRITVADRLAEKALGCMSKALYTEDLSNVADALGCSKKTGRAFVLEGGLGFRDVRFLVDVVWKSRKAIIPLRRDEILPGLPALVFVLCEMIIFSNDPKPTRPWGKLQDILLRCYLGDTSLPERAILRQLAIFLHHRIQEHKIPEDYVPVDQEDFCAIAGAWSDMLTPPLDLALAPIMLLDVSIILFRWIFRLMANPRENEGTLVAEWLAPAIMAGGFERLRLEIGRERDGPMALPRRGFTRNYAAELFGHSSVIAESIQSPTVKDKFVQSLYELDFHELAGRVLLLVTREDVNQYTENEPDKLMHYIASLDRISEALNDALPPHSPNLSESIFADWFKINSQMELYRSGILPSKVPDSIYLELMETWGLLLPRKFLGRNHTLEVSRCSYPRCADPIVYARHPEANSVCWRCGKAWYCSIRCQQMHSTLKTIDSHSACL